MKIITHFSIIKGTFTFVKEKHSLFTNFLILELNFFFFCEKRASFFLFFIDFTVKK